MKNSKILIITICSNSKLKGGSPYKKNIPSICSILPFHTQSLLKRRGEVLDLLLGGEAERNHYKLKNMQLNSDLVKGPDFGGNSSAKYLHAAERYTGRFYKEFHYKNSELLLNTSHHILILSGLYGIILPEELIQAYSCNLPDHERITNVWKKDHFLTSIVLAYVNKFGIKRIFDFTSQNIYRNLLEWARLGKKASILHAYGEQYTGPALLPALGELARDRILGEPDKTLLNITSGSQFYTSNERIILIDNLVTPDGFPEENVDLSLNRLKTDSVVPISNEKNIEQIAINSSGILEHPRDIRVTSGPHNTIFNQKISRIEDLPISVLSLFQKMSRCPDVLEVYFGEFKSNGPKYLPFKIKISPPRFESGHIFANLLGKGVIGRSQKLDIRVTKKREVQAYKMLYVLLGNNLAK